MIFAILGVIICQVSLFALAYLLLMRLYKRIRESLLTYIMARGENGSQLAEVAIVFSKMLASEIVSSAKGLMLNAASQESRQSTAETRQTLSSSPGIAGAILSMLPKRTANKMLNNPALMQMALNFMPKAGEGGNSESNGNHSSNDSMAIN